MTAVLDIDALPGAYDYTSKTTGRMTSLSDVVKLNNGAIRNLVAKGVVHVKDGESFGFAMANPDLDYSDPENLKPENFVLFVVYWGPDGRKYAANAVRKLIALLREHAKNPSVRSTFGIKHFGKGSFENTVESVNGDDTFPLGDFGHGGAVINERNGRKLPVAVSCYTEAEDGTVADELGDLLHDEMDLADAA